MLSRTALAVAVDAAQDGGTDSFFRERIAHADGMAVDHVTLEGFELIVGEADLSELADTGVQAVDDLAGVHLSFEPEAASLDALESRRREGDGFAVKGDRLKLFEG